jgi:hypothetical protein
LHESPRKKVNKKSYPLQNGIKIAFVLPVNPVAGKLTKIDQLFTIWQLLQYNCGLHRPEVPVPNG